MLSPNNDYYGWVFTNLAFWAILCAVAYDISTGRPGPSAAVMMTVALLGLLSLRGLKPED
jgi:hypothetical protein